MNNSPLYKNIIKPIYTTRPPNTKFYNFLTYATGLFNFVEGDKRLKYTSNDHLKVIKLYLENCGIRTIERLTGIRNSQISKWIENIASYVKDEFSKAQSNLNGVEDIEIVEIDELCTYIKKDQKMVGNISLYGLLLIEGRTKLLILK